MKVNQWTLGLAAAGVVSFGSVMQAEEGKQSPVMSALSPTVLSGYVNTSAIWNLGTGRTVVGRPFTTPEKQDGFNLDVVKVALEKPLSEDQWAAGYKVELLFGRDAQLYGTSFDTFGDNDFAGIKQAYVALRAPVGNGIDFKVGVFDAIIGYEGFDAGSNPNYSRNFAYNIQPFAHTGILASYRVSDVISISAGVANTYQQAINGKDPVESIKSYMGQIAITAPQDAGFLKGSTLYLGVIDGGSSADVSDTVNVYAGGTLATPVAGLSLGAAFDYRFGGASVDFGPVADPWAYAVSLYASFQATEKLKLNGRLEYVNGSDGSFYNAGQQIKLGGATLTADYALWANVISRVEFRWDHSLNGDRPFKTDVGSGHKNSYTLALNLIYNF
jgi:hypothetical protein